MKTRTKSSFNLRMYGALMIATAILFASALSSAAINVPFWHYNVTLDLEGKNVTLMPMTTTSTLNLVQRMVFIKGENSSDWAAIYLFESRRKSMSMDNQLWKTMKPVCKAVSSDAETFANRSGMVAHGEARVEHGFGQRCYAGMAPLSPSDSATSEYLLVLSHFLDENLNERVIASVGAEYTGSHLLDKNVSYTN